MDLKLKSFQCLWTENVLSGEETVQEKMPILHVYSDNCNSQELEFPLALFGAQKLIFQKECRSMGLIDMHLLNAIFAKDAHGHHALIT